jgi:hypothetical protein
MIDHQKGQRSTLVLSTKIRPDLHQKTFQKTTQKNQNSACKYITGVLLLNTPLMKAKQN